MPDTIMPSNGSIHRLEVDNFKSYKGHQVIGPFLNFTAIIGPNGAGKSNLMDAISFVLGVRSSHLRGSQLRDLVYAYDDKEREVRRKAHVKLVYLQGDGTELSFTRGITLQSASEYRIDDKVVSWDEYNNKMRSLGILVKARNFLVFQGDVESVSTKSPKELTALFEHISTSDELTKDYEELDSKREQAVQRTMFSYQKKKTTSGERKQKKEQKEEAEKHLALQEDLTKLKTEHFLYQLFNIDRDIKGTTAELEALNSELKAVEQEQGGVESEVKEKKKEQARHSKEVLLAEKKAAKKKADAEKKQPDLVKLKEEIKRVEKNLQASEKGLTAKKAEHEKQVAEVQKLEQSLEQLTTLLEENEGEESSSKMDLATNQLAEYNRLKAEAGAKTAKLQKERDALDAQQQTDLEAQRNLEDNISQLSAREQQLEGQEEVTLERRKKIVEAMEEAKGTLAEKKREAEEMAERNKKARTRSVTLQGQIEKIEGQIAEARADLRLSERDRKAAEALEGMKRLYGHAVRGRLSDLCEPTQRKYQMAIAVAMGKNFDAIVVEDEKTAKDCIQYLKEQRAPVMTFIPLQTIKAKAVPEHLRALGGSAKLILDVLQYDASLEKAFLFACGQTLVCDTVEETKKLAYSSERHKVVALDGTLIAKNGNVTGGVSSGMEAKSKRWDDKAVEALEKKREAYEAEKAELGDPRQLDLALQELQTSIAGIERKLQLSAVSLEELEKKIAEIRSERKVNSQKQKSVQPELVQIRDAVSKREAAMAKLQVRINEVKDRIFAEFSRGVGVASIREYEEKYLKEHKEMDERRLHLKNQIAKIKSQLEYERRRNTEEPVKQTKEQISEAKEELKELQQKLADVKEEVDAITAELDAITAESQESKQKADAVEEEISALKKQISEKTQAAGKLKKQITAKETHIEQLKSVRSEVLEACELEQVPLPRVDSDAAEDESEPMDVDSGEPSASEPATLRGTGIDYSSLSRKYQQPASGPEREKLESELRSRIEAMTAEMEKTAPNLKALDQYEQLRDKERGVVEEFEAARKEEKQITEEFNKVKNERYARFMAAFTHISTEIDSIYKQLTRDPDHPIGGTAYLSLENDEEPFLHGIKYTAMPPTKRFRNMEELSGGEKTVAALALLFAIHSFRPSPFFVLDEVDAALDNVNVARVAAYIHAKSRENAGQRNAGHSFQSVVISLKDTFFDKADGLIGVYRDHDQGCSRVLTKRLTTHD